MGGPSPAKCRAVASTVSRHRWGRVTMCGIVSPIFRADLVPSSACSRDERDDALELDLASLNPMLLETRGFVQAVQDGVQHGIGHVLHGVSGS